MMNILVIY